MFLRGGQASFRCLFRGWSKNFDSFWGDCWRILQQFKKFDPKTAVRGSVRFCVKSVIARYYWICLKKHWQFQSWPATCSIQNTFFVLQKPAFGVAPPEAGFCFVCPVAACAGAQDGSRPHFSSSRSVTQAATRPDTGRVAPCLTGPGKTFSGILQGIPDGNSLA